MSGVTEYSIIIPYHSNEILLCNCVDSLLKTTPDVVEIIVVANNSEERFTNVKFNSSRVKVIRINKNLYYSKAINLGCSNSNGKLLIFCDTDTFYYGNWFKNLTEFYKNHEGVGLAGSKLINFYNNRIIDYGIAFSSFNSPHPYMDRPLDYKFVSNSKRVQAACSANAIISREVFEKVGMFNEDLGYSYADIDLCLKLKEHGYETWVVHNSVVYHKGNSVLANMSGCLKGDIKAKFIAYNHHRIEVDVDKYFYEAFSYFKGQVDLRTQYFLIDLATIYDKEWHYNMIKNFLAVNITDVYDKPFHTRDHPNIPLFELLGYQIRDLRFPIIYFVDRYTSLEQNAIWQHMRQFENDIVIDRNANILFLREVIGNE